MSDDALFDATPLVVPDPDAGLGHDARLTARRLRSLKAGIHPTTCLPLHTDAPPPDDRDAPGPRCGTCTLKATLEHHGRTYAKCTWGPVTHGPGTDVRAWWPACRAWTEADRG